MALRRTHIASAEVIMMGYAISTNQPLPIIITETIGVWIGSQLPDIDQRQTRINKKTGIETSMFTLWGHRTWSHSIWIPALLFILARYSSNSPMLNGISVYGYKVMGYFYFTLALGYFLHELLDAFSVEGIRWLYPLGDRKIIRKKGIFRYKVHSMKEIMIRYVSIIFIVFELIFYLYKTLK
ncbi:metal-dependent hydrolase [Apilactobacillus nanyangensis]|uniref:Metal-dependent hydrolase n=1 Tax=Apilactobacillus nanyangensis TaxID=2799579 RepID=A0ABT0HZ45_9LACO|nr:metal-dependent hydrolase [Apilactobacillus nanyangensis]MCK8612201.1 metal-dependent hydrolase [Apilactobacillus nanyangensis]